MLVLSMPPVFLPPGDGLQVVRPVPAWAGGGWQTSPTVRALLGPAHMRVGGRACQFLPPCWLWVSSMNAESFGLMLVMCASEAPHAAHGSLSHSVDRVPRLPIWGAGTAS